MIQIVLVLVFLLVFVFKNFSFIFKPPICRVSGACLATKPQNMIEGLNASLDGLRSTPTFRFFGLAFLAYVVWSVAYEQVLKPSTTLDEVVIEHMVRSTEAVFEAVGWPVGTYPQPSTHRGRVGVAGHAGVQIGAPCDGVALFALFAIFILAFPGPISRKAWFISAGIALLHLANIGRVVVLTRIQATSPEWLEFNMSTVNV